MPPAESPASGALTLRDAEDMVFGLSVGEESAQGAWASGRTPDGRGSVTSSSRVPVAQRRRGRMPLSTIAIFLE